MEHINPLNDYLFLKIMGEQGDEEQCLAFLNAVLADSKEAPLRLVKILENRTLTPEVLGNKANVLDFRALAETENEKDIKVNIEVQLKDFHNMSERTLYYWAREYVDGIKEGEDYNELPRVITINIVNFDHIKLDKFHTTFRLREDEHRDFILTKNLEIHFLNMVRFRRMMKARKKEGNEMTTTALERWMSFLDENTSNEELAELIKTDSAIGKAHSRLLEVTRDEEIMRNYTMRQKALSDWTTGVNTAFEKGIEKGIKKGRMEGIAEGRMENARLMKADGVPFEQIAHWTKLPLETIEKL